MGRIHITAKTIHDVITKAGLVMKLEDYIDMLAEIENEARDDDDVIKSIVADYVDYELTD